MYTPRNATSGTTSYRCAHALRKIHSLEKAFVVTFFSMSKMSKPPKCSHTVDLLN